MQLFRLYSTVQSKRKEVITVNFRRILMKTGCVALSVLMLSSSIPVFAESGDSISITNPYSNIDWENVNQYKTALHTHTNASDGDITLRESLERHYESGFDIVATTDHGTVNYSWSEFKGPSFIGKALKLFGRTDFNLDYLGTEGSFAKGMTYKIETRNGDDYLVTADGREMMRIPYGIENNAVSVNAHVNSWFADFRNNLPCDYYQAITGVEKKGGVSVINHPGEYTNARYELFQEDAYNLSNPSYRYFFNKFYGMINDYDSCIGIDINSKGDDRTRYDRKLWDLMLAEAGKSGKTVYAIASSDAHQTNKIDTGFTYILAENKTSEAVRSALLNGEFFASSTCLCNHDEMKQIADSIKKFYGETPLYKELTDIVARYEQARLEKLNSSSDSNVSVKYEAIDDDGYFNRPSRTMINEIQVDDDENTISIDSENALVVRWISNGQVIETTKSSDGTIDLDDYSDVLGDYVRAEVFGEGGIVYTQAFTINAAEKEVQEFTYKNYGMFDFLFAEIDRYGGLLVRIIKNLFK